MKHGDVLSKFDDFFVCVHETTKLISQGVYLPPPASSVNWFLPV